MTVVRRKRIVTFMGTPNFLDKDPLTMLAGGSVVITAPPKRRLYAIRTVTYDDSMTPLYARRSIDEVPVESLEELYKTDLPDYIKDAPILDVDNYLKVFNNE